jgi:phenylpropionate dioxygenase-like ring-hydroxylating dioxygenase large terminal subunit
VIADPVLIDEWHVVARAESLAEGALMPVRLLGEDLVLWRSGGAVLAWQDLCIHRGARLSLGRITASGCVECPYHGWTYSAAGACVLMPAHPEQTPPAKARVKTYHAREQYGWLWVCAGNPDARPIPPFAEWSDPAFRTIHCGPYHFRASAPRVIENFLDVAHFPFVHEGYLGDRAHTRIEEYAVTTGEAGVVAEGIRIWQPDPDGTGIGRHVTYTYRVHRPLVAYFVKEMAQTFSILFAITPVSEFESTGWMWMNYNYAHDIPEAELRAFQDTVAAQDIPIVESQRPERLPLDLQSELHLRSDQTAIAYRRWLGALGVTFGTA